MKKINFRKSIPVAMGVFAIFLAANAPALAAPPVLPISIRNELGNTLYLDEYDSIRYETERMKRQKIDRATSPDGTEVIQGGSQDASSIRATVEEIDTKGVYVNSVQVSPSEILSQEEITNVVQGLVGKNVFINDIQAAIDGINALYSSKGYVTARAFLPEQKVEGGKIYIELIESKIGELAVTNNRWTSAGHITKRMEQKKR